ncbi:MAG: crotonase/enoyl-CoA hydratase family protein [Pseudomonadota bacterium]
MTGTAWPIDLPDCITVEQRGEIGLIALNRPKKRNALSDEIVLGLDKAFSHIPDGIKAVVLHGIGDHFCAGLDLNELRETTTFEGMQTSVIGQGLNNTIQFARVPVIAVLKGAVIGGGFELAASAHIRVAEPTAFYALPEGTRGIFLGSGGTVRLPRLIGTAVVMDMMLTGRVFNAADAHTELRFSQYLVEEDAGVDKALELAAAVAKNGEISNFGIIQALPRIADIDPTTGLFTELLMAGIAQDSPEAKARLREFLEMKMNKVKQG